jgi:phage replication-related protein YjqB (UPF0714/DUF867 family)
MSEPGTPDPASLRHGRDVYASYGELAAHEQEGLDYRIHCIWRDAHLTVVAPHGGGIEPGTLPITRALAGDQYNLYAFEGLKTGAGNRCLHLTSHRFDEPRCLQLLARSRRVLVIHGRATPDPTACLGGLDAALKAHLAAALESAGIPVVPVRGLAGNHPSNLCNRGLQGAGVQLELGSPLRHGPERENVITVLRDACACFLADSQAPLGSSAAPSAEPGPGGEP